MSDLEWKIEDGRLWVERTGEGYRAWWDPATADEAAAILQSVMEKCAQVADSHVAQHDGSGYPPGLKSALKLEGRSIASAIRSLQITGEGKMQNGSGGGRSGLEA